MFGCKHDWVILGKTVLPSGFEQLVSDGGKLTSLSGAPMPFFRKTVQVILKCQNPNCGALKTITESNY